MNSSRFRLDVLQIQVLGRERRIQVELPEGPSNLVDILPLARALADDLTAAAVEAARAEGREISCRAGCSACCRQLIGISAIEAQGFADLVASMPIERRARIAGRFREALRRLEGAGLLDPAAPPGDRTLRGLEPGRDPESGRAVSRKYMSLRIACPFLEDESCGIYEDRPLMCREYNVSSPAELCADPHRSPVKKVTPPIHLGVPLARTAAEIAGVRAAVLPLILSLEWAGRFGEKMRRVRDGREISSAFFSMIDARQDTPFDDRGEKGPTSPPPVWEKNIRKRPP